MTTRQALTLSIRMTVLIALFIAAVFFLRIPISQSQTRTLATVSAASFEPGAPVAPESIAAIFGVDLAKEVSIVNTLPLPTELLGTSVGVRDSAGVERLAFLFFISPGQINCLIPAGTAEGTATITVRSGKGNTETGTVLVSRAAPSILTANASGIGAAAAVALRIKADNSFAYERILQGAYPNIVPAAIDLGPESDKVFLVLYLCGLRFVRKEDVRVLLGGNDVPPDDFIYSPSEFVGVDQLAVRLPRSLIGRGRLKLSVVAQGRVSNQIEFEIGGRIVSTAPQINAISKTTDVLAGEEITLTGAQFAASARDNVVKLGTRPATVTSASSGQLRIRVPYGAEGGAISVVTPQGEGRSNDELKIRTTISGFVKDTHNAPIPGVKVTMDNTTVQTNSEGLFFINQANAGNVVLQFDGRAVTSALFPDPPIKYRISANRDNLVETPVFLLQVNGAQTQIGSALSGSPETQEDITLTTAAPDQTGVGELKFVVPAGTTIRFPNGATSGTLTLNAEPNGLTPIALPPDNFVSVIAQLAFFGATLNPGGKLIFPNPEQLPPGTVARLYQYDVAVGSPTRGEWVDLKDTVTVFADRIETSANAIKQSTYYFIAAQRPVTTAIGRVIEDNNTPQGRPVAGATVRIRGRETVTDGNGGFVLRNIGVNGDGKIFADVNLLRANGQVDSKQSAGVQAVLNGVTNLGTIVLATDAIPNRPPVALIPSSITVTAGQQFDQPFTASDPDPGQTISLQVSDTRLAAIIARGGNAYTLRLTPALSDANTTIKLTLTVTDNLGASQGFDIAVIVRGTCSYSIVPASQAFTANGGTGSVTVNTSNGCAWTASSNAAWLTISAGANGSGNGTVSYSATANTVTSPRTGTLTVAGQTFTVTQAGTDSPNPLQWRQTTGPTGGDIRAFTVIGTNLFAGTYGGGVFRSTDNGASWAQVINGLTNTDVRALTVSGTNLFAGTDGSGVFRSTDNGTSWTQVNNGLTNARVFALTVSGTSLFAGTYLRGVFRSTDNGTSWTQVNNGLANTIVFTLTVNAASLFAGTDGGGVFRSTDNGASWTAVNNGLTDTGVFALTVSGTSLFAGTYLGGVFRSTDNGASWAQVINGLTNTDVRTLTVSGTSLFAGTSGGGVLRSTDNGTNWTPINNGLTATTVLALTVSGTSLFAGTNSGGVFRSTDNGASWTQVNNGLTATDVRALTVSGTSLFAGTYGGGVFRSTDNGASWTAINNGLTDTNVLALTVSGTSLFAGTDHSLFRSTDNGASWTQVNNGLTATFVRALTVSGTSLFAGTDGGGVFRSTDNGASWTAINNGLTNNYVYALTVSGTSLFAGTSDGVFRSTDNGASWMAVNNRLANLFVFTLTVNGTSLFAGTYGGGVFLSTDNGASWTEVNNGLADTYVYALTVNGTSLFASTSGSGVFRSTDNGASWTAINSGLTNLRVRSFVGGGTKLFAGTSGGGVFVADLTGLP